MLQRIPEPELMNDEEQARAYAEADFSEPHDEFVRRCAEVLGHDLGAASVLDLGCGPADVTARFARAYPMTSIDGVDGAEAMLRLGRERLSTAQLDERVRLHHAILPAPCGQLTRYDVVLSNSLLHHLAVPGVLWEAVRRYAKPGAAVCIMDLMRPSSVEEVKRLVALHAADAPPVLRRDFEASLFAAYTPREVDQQLREVGLTTLHARALSDRHLWVSGRV